MGIFPGRFSWEEKTCCESGLGLIVNEKVWKRKQAECQYSSIPASWQWMWYNVTIPASWLWMWHNVTSCPIALLPCSFHHDWLCPLKLWDKIKSSFLITLDRHLSQQWQVTNTIWSSSWPEAKGQDLGQAGVSLSNRERLRGEPSVRGGGGDTTSLLLKVLSVSQFSHHRLADSQKKYPFLEFQFFLTQSCIKMKIIGLERWFSG